MARLKDFRVDTKALNDGIWVRVGEEYGDLEILARGTTDAFFDAKNALETKYVTQYGGSRDAIPNAILRDINAQLLEKHLIVDVRNLEGDDGQPLSVTEFHKLMYDAEYSRLSAAAWRAVGRASNQFASQVEMAVGNLPTPSKSNSTGATSENA